MPWGGSVPLNKQHHRKQQAYPRWLADRQSCIGQPFSPWSSFNVEAGLSGSDVRVYEVPVCAAALCRAIADCLDNVLLDFGLDLHAEVFVETTASADRSNEMM